VPSNSCQPKCCAFMKLSAQLEKPKYSIQPRNLKCPIQIKRVVILSVAKDLRRQPHRNRTVVPSTPGKRIFKSVEGSIKKDRCHPERRPKDGRRIST
jgi:hypothetical protein